MGAQIREYRNRIRAVSSTKKITRAMELHGRCPRRQGAGGGA